MRTCNLGSLTMATIFGHTHIKGIIIHNSTYTIIYRPKWSRMRKWMTFTKPYQALPSLTNPEPTIFSVDMATQRVLRNPVELLNHASYRARTALED